MKLETKKFIEDKPHFQEDYWQSEEEYPKRHQEHSIFLIRGIIFTERLRSECRMWYALPVFIPHHSLSSVGWLRRGGSRPDRSPLHQRADIIPLCNVFLTLNEMEHILSCYINQIVMLNVLSWRDVKPYNVGRIIAPGEVNNPVMVWIIFFSRGKSETSVEMFWDSE